MVDKKALRKAYLDKSRQVHPDVSGQDVVDEHSASFNNEAYTILNDDMAVVKYMLDIHDMPIDAKNAPMPQDFLLEMMDKADWTDRVPTLLVRGMKSDIVDDDGVADLRRRIPALEIADIRGAGHMVAGDKNDEFNAAVIEFLTRVMPPKQ